jgi:hypothetical protein
MCCTSCSIFPPDHIAYKNHSLLTDNCSKCFYRRRQGSHDFLLSCFLPPKCGWSSYGYVSSLFVQGCTAIFVRLVVKITFLAQYLAFAAACCVFEEFLL